MTNNNGNNKHNWIHILWNILLTVTFILSVIEFINSDSSQSSILTLLMDFIPTIVCLFLYIIMLFIINVFANATVSGMLTLSLLFITIILYSVSAFSKKEDSKNLFKDIALLTGGLTFGVPIGERVKRE